MTFLVDTHIFIDLLQGNEKRFSKEAKNIFQHASNQFWVSAVCLWEISIKYALGKLELSKPPDAWLLDTIQKIGWQTLSIGPLHALAVSSLPFYHRDPFDRLLVAQAKTEDLPVVTRDGIFKKYGVKAVW
ncbi:MAG: type II toxin-antitoxin system VapC family toxin [Deltaproteobacteria bacterium]|nr:type II toxin-antitoxin system VapC family toxin [Deltaproteobacteria bacterium]